MSSRCFRLFTLITLSLCCGIAGDSRPAVVATVNGDPITSTQLDSAVRKQVEQLEDRIRQLRQAALNKLIDNLLLEQAARAEQITVADYLARHIESLGVTGAEVGEAYERSRDQFPGVLPAEAKYRIRRTLEDNRRGAALKSLLEGLRRKAQITSTLDSDRLAALDFAAQEGPAVGDAAAPVTIVEFSDFQCPYCRAAQPLLRRILARQPGRVRLVFRHFPLDQHADALPAARASVCAERQGRFWPLHDRIFALESLSASALRSAAFEAGLGLPAYDACMADEETVERVRKDILLGRMIGVGGTPTFFVNREAVTNTADLEAAVEKILGGTR